MEALMVFAVNAALLVLAAQGQATASATACKAPACIEVPDEKNYTQDEYLLYLSPWSRFYDENMQRGSDYENMATVTPTEFPGDTTISWRWPEGALPQGAGVWGYLAIAYGNFSGGVTEVPVVAKQIKDIAALEQTFDFEFQGSENFNLLAETFLTEKAGDHEARLLEVGFFAHAPSFTANWLANGSPIGTFKDRDVSWTVAQHGKFVTFVPDNRAILNSGTVDYKAAFDFLIEEGVITSEAWFNGLGFGIEPTLGGGSGSLTINELYTTYR